VKKPITVTQLLAEMGDILQLEQAGGATPTDREIKSAAISGPGLALAGYVERFPARRLQVLGETEISYLASLDPAERRRVVDLFCSFPIPCVFVTKGQVLPEGLSQAASVAGIPIFRSRLKTNDFYQRIKPWLEDAFAPTTTLHGSLADVYGVGLLFVGKSGIGKSECVLDLVERGHRLVADDIVLTTRRGADILIGRGHELQRHHMEIRGIGLIDVPTIFGVRAVRQQKRIEVVVELEEWNQDAVIERTGLDIEAKTILDVELPMVRVPLNPGKNITVVCEVIAMNHLLRYSGVNVAERFNERLIGRMRAAMEVQRYLQEDNE
jgi:HPr kinase/phosphorylase